MLVIKKQSTRQLRRLHFPLFADHLRQVRRTDGSLRSIDGISSNEQLRPFAVRASLPAPVLRRYHQHQVSLAVLYIVQGIGIGRLQSVEDEIVARLYALNNIPHLHVHHPRHDAHNHHGKHEDDFRHEAVTSNLQKLLLQKIFYIHLSNCLLST